MSDNEKKTQKQVLLTPDVFRLNGDGTVQINEQELTNVIRQSVDELANGEQGIKVGVSVSV